MQTDASQTRKRSRRPKSMALQSKQEIEATPSPSAGAESISSVPDFVEEDTARPKLAASALSARKASQESDSSTEVKFYKCQYGALKYFKF